MAKVKIYLEPHETPEDAEEMLKKALQHHEAGKEHKQAFHNPAARDVFNKLIKEHEKTWKKMMDDIFEVIDKDVF